MNKKMQKSMVTLIICFFLFASMTENKVLDDPEMNKVYDKLDFYKPLITRLINDGMNEDVVKHLFLDPRVEFYSGTIQTNLTPPKIHPLDQVTYEKSEHKDVQYFMKKYRVDLRAAEKKYGVDSEAIAAILYVETKLGHIIGRYSTFNVLSSISLAGMDHFQPMIEESIQGKYHYRSYEEREKLISWLSIRAKSRGQWAYRELKELILIHETTNIDVLDIRGSWAGAFGLPQFMPSSYRAYAVDGNHDGVIDLYSIPDAVHSIANYLKHAGWSRKASLYRKRKAIWRYNHSRQYVNNVMAIISRLENT